jgi:hypothetical protein
LPLLPAPILTVGFTGLAFGLSMPYACILHPFQQYLASYLGLRNTRALETVLEQFHKTIHHFAKHQNNNFEVPTDRKRDSTKLTTIFKEIKADPVPPNVAKLTEVQTRSRLSLTDPCFSLCQGLRGSKPWIAVVTLAQCCLMIKLGFFTVTGFSSYQHHH